MTRIAFRHYLDPLDPVNLSTANLKLGRNSGNLIFTASAQRALMVPGQQLTGLTLRELRLRGAQLNEEFDHVVIPLANAFRPEFLPHLKNLTGWIRQLTIPVTILGVGSQASILPDQERNPEIDEAAREFAAAVLDRSASIGVRGERTADYLGTLGFANIDVIGCPSMFYRGPDLSIRESRPEFGRDTRLALNLTPNVATPEGWTESIAAKHPESIYIAQDQADLAMMLGGAPIKKAKPGFPAELDHTFLKKNRTRLHLHAPTWIESMSEFDFVFGHRIHGNISALLAGTPAHVIVHDSRTQELVDYFDIPHTPAKDITAETRVEELWEKSDWSKLVSGHPARLATFADFLNRHGLDHCALEPKGSTDFDCNPATSPRGAEAVVTPRSAGPHVLEERLWQSERWSHLAIKKLQQENAELRQTVAELSATKPGLRERISRRNK